MSTLAPSKVPSDFPAGAGIRNRTGTDHGAEIALVASVLLAACGHLLIKAGLNGVILPAGDSLLPKLLRYLLAPRVFFGLAVYGSGTLLWIVAVAKRDISYLFPVTAMNFVLISLGGMWFFGETVSTGRWIGILVVMLGVALMQASATGQKS